MPELMSSSQEYYLSIDTIHVASIPRITTSRSIGRSFKTISKALATAHRYARKHFGGNYQFICLPYELLTVESDEVIILSEHYDGMYNTVKQIQLTCSRDREEIA